MLRSLWYLTDFTLYFGIAFEKNNVKDANVLDLPALIDDRLSDLHRATCDAACGR